MTKLKRGTATAKNAKTAKTKGSKGAVAYDEDAIKSLDPLAHIRLRTGMYIGRVGDGSNPDDGIYVLLKEVVDNAIDEFIMGAGKRVEIDLAEDGSVSVRDYGRGIPLGKVVDCVSKINTGGKYNDDVFQFSVGLNGIGTKAVNALSEHFLVTSWRDGRYVRAEFGKGKKKTVDEGTEKGARNGTLIRFRPDPEIFNDFHWRGEYIAKRLQYYAYLNSGLTLAWAGEQIRSTEGLKDLLAHEIGEEGGLYPICHHQEDQLEFAFTHTGNYGESYYSFVNGQYTNDGGTHQSAFREGVLKGINEFSDKKFAGEDVRDRMVGAVAIKLQDPVFESQTKNKLGSTEVRPWIVKQTMEAVLVWLHKHPAEAEAVFKKIKANERVRTELASIKKQARERAKKVAIRIPKLTDCKVHFTDAVHKRRDETTVFLVEGDSAGGSLIQCRDVYTQAVFRLKGKPLNCYGLKLDTVYKNEELYNIMQAVGIEDGVENLRYNRVVIATDADVDGMHIRNLLLTYFLRYFEDLVVKGHVYILETPLFRVRNKHETRYCYDEQERAVAVAELAQPEVTRFKGLGEISPREFARFISEEDMRLLQVSIESMHEVGQVLKFYMGKNTPERREFIIDNLIPDIA